MKRCCTTIWHIIISLIYHYGRMLLPLVSDQISRIKVMYYFCHLLVLTSKKYKTVFNQSFSLSKLLCDLKCNFKITLSMKSEGSPPRKQKMFLIYIINPYRILEVSGNKERSFSHSNSMIALLWQSCFITSDSTYWILVLKMNNQP